MNLKEKLKWIEISITELSNYLSVSRPTLYKLIDLYDKKSFKEIDKEVLKLFNFIYENELIGKNNVINYILKNIVKISENNVERNDKEKAIYEFIKYNNKSQKIDFMSLISTSNELDSVIFFLLDVMKAMKKRSLKQDEKEKINIFNKFEKEIKEAYKGE